MGTYCHRPCFQRKSMRNQWHLSGLIAPPVVLHVLSHQFKLSCTRGINESGTGWWDRPTYKGPYRRQMHSRQNETPRQIMGIGGRYRSRVVSWNQISGCLLLPKFQDPLHFLDPSLGWVGHHLLTKRIWWSLHIP